MYDGKKQQKEVLQDEVRSKAGKVRAIRLSNFSKEQIQEILDEFEIRPTVLQTEVHPYFQEKELKSFLEKEGIMMQAWYPLGHGDKTLLEEIPLWGGSAGARMAAWTGLIEP